MHYEREFQWSILQLYMFNDEATPEQREKNYQSARDSYISRRNLNEIESFRRISSINQKLVQECNHLKNYYSKVDPGTAGDMVEAIVVKLLQDLLPSYTVKSKAIIRNDRGESSPQIDVVVLDKSYPKDFLDEISIHYKSVILAIECKLTLENQHLKKCAETAAFLKSIEYKTKDYLQVPTIQYGIFALSSKVTKKGCNEAQAVADRLIECSEHHNPLFLLDFVVVPERFYVDLDLALEDDWVDYPKHSNDTPKTYWYLTGKYESWLLNIPFCHPDTDPLGLFYFHLLHRMARQTGNDFSAVIPNFEVFDTISDYTSDDIRLNPNDTNCNMHNVYEGRINKKNSKIKMWK